jgi:hypothetical protein
MKRHKLYGECHKLYGVVSRRGLRDRWWTFESLRDARRKRDELVTRLGWEPGGRDAGWSLIAIYRLKQLR